MRIPRPPHRWDVSPARAAAIQRHLRGRLDMNAPRGPLRYVAGVDAAFTDGECVAGAVLWDRERRVVEEERTAVRPLSFPYVPGLLSFREAPAVLAALRKLGSTPDAIITDGHGYAHPRRFGIACHIGILCDVPTIGCAKSRLVGGHRTPAERRGGRSALRDAGERVGTVLRTRTGVRPVYVSIGHRVDLVTAEHLVLACATRYRLPEPVRLADRLVARAKRGL